MQMDSKKAIWGWALYDWANSAFATTVMAGFFPLLFKDFWCAGVDQTVSTARLSMANSVAGITVALLAPILGAIADKGTNKKKFLLFFATMGIVMTAGLFLVEHGLWKLAVGLYIFGAIGFSGGNIFYDSLITSVASGKNLDTVSALGFSLGYLGGGALFALNVWMANNPERFGFADIDQAVRFGFLSVAIWWAVFSIPIFLLVKEPRSEKRISVGQMVISGIKQLLETFRKIRQMKMILLFLLAYWLYIDGLDTIVRMAVDYGKSLGFANEDLIKALLIVQFVGFPAALGYGYLGKSIGAKRAILLGIVIYLGITFWGVFMQAKWEFYVMAVAIGLVQGGIQALSRSMYARMIPADKSAEFFGFYNMLGKFAVVIGPIMMGGVGLLVRRMGYSSDIASRVGLGSIALLFVAGGIMLCFVKVQPQKI